MPQSFSNFIGGQWIGAASGRTFETRNPADTSEVVGVYPKCGVDETRHAIEAARIAQPAWAAVPAPKRGEIFFRAAGLLESRADGVAAAHESRSAQTAPRLDTERPRAYDGGARRGATADRRR